MSDPSTRLERAIAELGAEHEPPPGWQAQVLAAIEPKRQQPQSRWRPRAWWAAFPAAAAAAVVVFLIWSGQRAPVELALAIEPVQGQAVRGEVMRGEVKPDEVALHSRQRVVVRGGAGEPALWVFRNERALVAACPGQAGCTRTGDTLSVEVTADLIGTYQVIALSSPVALPAPTGTLDDALAAADAAHAVRKQHEFTVR